MLIKEIILVWSKYPLVQIRYFTIYSVLLFSLIFGLSSLYGNFFQPYAEYQSEAMPQSHSFEPSKGTFAYNESEKNLSSESLYTTAKKIIHDYLEKFYRSNSSSITSPIKLSVKDELALIDDEQNKTAIAIFEIPDQKMSEELTDEQKKNAKNVFDVYSIENNGLHKVVRFRYQDKKLLPENKQQALLLLYAPYVKNKSLQEQIPSDITQENEIRIKSSLNDLQQAAVKGNYHAATKGKSNFMQDVSGKEGFIGSTLIKTNEGYRKLEDIRVDDLVACRDPKTGQQTYSKITFADKVHLSKHVQITINDDVVHVAPDHKFYAASVDKWYTAQELKNYPDLRNAIDPRIKDVQEVNQELDVVRITVDKNHNFYITKHDILAHNYIELIAELGIEGAIFTWEVVVPAVVASATGIGVVIATLAANKSTKNNKQLMKEFDKSTYSNDGSYFPSPPDPDDKNKGGKFGKYEDAPYHHKNSSGKKSPAPKKGQGALDNSVSFSPESTGRVGISEGEFVVLSCTRENLYHGHVRSWNELTGPMQKALKRAGKVTSSGKIIK